jgi:hypothetical protein
MLKKGTIVTILAPKSDFNGKQGEIVSWDEKNKLYIIKLNPRFEYLVGAGLSGDDKYVRFEETELRTEDDWEPLNKVHTLFGRDMWHTVEYSESKFVPGEECCHQGCHKKASRRIMVNVWGTVLEEDVCDEHAKMYHGKCIDGPFPNKPPKQQAKAG